jgi:glycosyltransferase involved in cell wall biosynthesis
MIKQIKKMTVRRLFRYYFKRKKYATIATLSKLPILKSDGYWAVQQLLNRGYLDLSYEVLQSLPYKEHFKHIVHRIESMIDIKENGFLVEKREKKPVKHIHVLFVVHNSLSYDNAGYAIRTHHIVTTLQKKDIKISVATRPGYPWDLQKHKHLTERNKINNIDGIEYIRLKDEDMTFKKGPDDNYIDTYAGELFRTAATKDTTIMHANSNYLNGLAAIRAANKLNIPSIYEARGFWHKTRTTLDTGFKGAGMFAYESIMEKAAIEAADAVVVISSSLKKLIESWGADPAKIHIIPNAVDIDRFVSKEPNIKLIEKYGLQDKTVIGFIGSLTGYEGLKEVILAVDQLIDEGLNIVLMIIGDGREKKNLEQLARSKNIIFTGKIPHETVEEYYALFDICPYPRNDFEICHYVPPLKVLEAMAMQKAVIVSNIAPLLDIVENGKNGLVCEPDNIESLKSSILKLYHNKMLRDTLGEKARKWVEKNRSLNSMSQKYLHLYNSFKEDNV